jgi:hypothetical protein
MRTIAAALFMFAALSGAASAGPGGAGGWQQNNGQPGSQQGAPNAMQDTRRGDDQVGAVAQMSDLLRAGYRVVAAYEGALVLVRDDHVFVCTYTQYREGGGGGVRLVSQGCSEVREPRYPR